MFQGARVTSPICKKKAYWLFSKTDVKFPQLCESEANEKKSDTSACLQVFVQMAKVRGSTLLRVQASRCAASVSRRWKNQQRSELHSAVCCWEPERLIDRSWPVVAGGLSKQQELKRNIQPGRSQRHWRGSWWVMQLRKICGGERKMWRWAHERGGVCVVEKAEGMIRFHGSAEAKARTNGKKGWEPNYLVT